MNHRRWWIGKHPNQLKLQKVLTEELEQTFANQSFEGHKEVG
tara:strand:- start:198 stop:323 length:126 start_codon:yes stop_codon:yes gene_type:complete